MSTAAATVSLTASLSLPPLQSVLDLPTTIGSVPVATLASAFSKAGADISKLIIDVKAHHWRDAAELGVDDGLYIAGLAGVPGASVAATLVPYLFDLVNAEVDGRGKVSVDDFVRELAYSQTNLGQIVDDISNRDWTGAAQLELDDLADVASTFGAGPAATLAKAAVNIGFAIAKTGGDAQAFTALFGALEQFAKDAAALPGEIAKEVEGKPLLSPDGNYRWDPLHGWVLLARTS